ncbi:hypothetical protein ACVWYU_004581 [Pseudomonas sp. TE12234]
MTTIDFSDLNQRLPALALRAVLRATKPDHCFIQ